MTPTVDPQLALWGNFYAIVGAAAAALIGIQFVVIALIAARTKVARPDAIGAFGTPTVVHLGGALVVSALMAAPWPALAPASIAVGVCGVGGLGYAMVTIRRARRQTDYTPVLEDWVFHGALPSLAYSGLVGASLLLERASYPALVAIGASALVLLLVGIHNAWDTVTHFLITTALEERKETE
jgi:hypothetical protein